MNNGKFEELSIARELEIKNMIDCLFLYQKTSLMQLDAEERDILSRAIKKYCLDNAKRILETPEEEQMRLNRKY